MCKSYNAGLVQLFIACNGWLDFTYLLHWDIYRHQCFWYHMDDTWNEHAKCPVNFGTTVLQQEEIDVIIGFCKTMVEAKPH